MYFEEEVTEECYNRTKKMLDTLENYEHEIIFVNDGSKDRTLQILENIAKSDNNVKILSFSRNSLRLAGIPTLFSLKRKHSFIVEICINDTL